MRGGTCRDNRRGKLLLVRRSLEALQGPISIILLAASVYLFLVLFLLLEQCAASKTSRIQCRQSLVGYTEARVPLYRKDCDDGTATWLMGGGQ